MPCYDPPIDSNYHELSQLQQRIKQLEAMLCACLTTAEKHFSLTKFFDVDIDFIEVGVPLHDILKWWDNHKVEDARRRQVEAEQRRIEQLKISAKSKINSILTPEEKEVLGLK